MRSQYLAAGTRHSTGTARIAKRRKLLKVSTSAFFSSRQYRELA